MRAVRDDDMNTMEKTSTPSGIQSQRARISAPNAELVEPLDLNELESDDFSFCSRLSESCCDVQANMDSESAAEVSSMRVRDMINLYNLATEKNQELSQAKSMYFGVNKFNSPPSNAPNKQLTAQSLLAHDVEMAAELEHTSALDLPQKQVSEMNVDPMGTQSMRNTLPLMSSACAASDTADKRASDKFSDYMRKSAKNPIDEERPADSDKCIECVIQAGGAPGEHVQHMTATNSGNARSSSKVAKLNKGGFRIMTTDGQTSLKHNECHEDGMMPVEMSYKSKTTIKKSENGVRIIIDIFFDKEHDINLVGSRVETDIPESRILTEFQRQALAMKSLPRK